MLAFPRQFPFLLQGKAPVPVPALSQLTGCLDPAASSLKEGHQPP